MKRIHNFLKRLIEIIIHMTFGIRRKGPRVHVHVKNAKTFQSSRTVLMKNSRDHKTERVEAFFVQMLLQFSQSTPSNI